MSKKGILIVSFGTSYEDTRRKTIGAIEESIQKAFPDYKVYRAFTSKIIKRNLEKKGVLVFNVQEAIEQIMKDGDTKELIVQPTFITNGIEYDMLHDDINPYYESFEKIYFGHPLLTGQEDYKELATIMKEAFPIEEDEVLVLMGHGSDHHANAAYPAFEDVLEEMGYDRILVGTLEGYPSLNEVKKQLAKLQVKKLCLAPMMIVAGNHANHDMIGGEGSWKWELEKAGYEVRYYMNGLGELEGVQQMFIRHVRETEELLV
ncbi:MAG: sirohydrochlorin cobaltochelatase [Clostridium sp.]|nr:sirohydrochlorin cobaltochelatase [Clostridium sp.]